MDGRQTSPRSEGDDAQTLEEGAERSQLAAPPLQRGATLDRYVVLEPLGAGAMGLVYAAYDPKLDRRIALKLLHVRGGPEVGTRRAQRLLREAQALAQLSHPNVVTVHDVGTADDRVFLAMEYVQGQTLTRWLGTQPSWHAVLDVFVAAGRGLAAAHAKGLVHRDFKPDNVMLGDDGRVRVMDFGLARARDDGSVDESSARGVDLSTQITRTGALMGTPAYMAPEQHLGQAVDARSDQFSFCVALYEGLFGVRPFAGESVAAIGMAATRGLLTEPPPGRTVPKWLRRVVLRGLRPSPSERFTDMGQVLSALEADRGRRRRWVAGSAAALTLAIGGLWWSQRSPAPAPCRDAADHLRGVWDPERAATVAAAMRASGSPVADQTIERVGDRLDRYTHDWVEMRTRSCEATRIRGEQSEALLDLRNACLDQHLRRVGDLVGVLEQADADTVHSAAWAAASLPSVEPCGDTEALLAAVPPPPDPQTARAVEHERERLARVRALTAALRIADGLALARAITTQAEALGYRPLLAEALVARGHLEGEDGRYPDAEHTLTRAHAEALACGHDHQAARASQFLAFVIGDRQQRLEDGLRWAQISEAEYARAGRLDERAGLLLARGTAYLAAGRLDAAEHETRQALALVDHDGHPQAYLRPVAHANLAEQLRQQGRRAEAREHLEHARAQWERELGPDHPELALVLHTLGLVDLEDGDLDGAARRFERAIALRERALGPDHPLVATTLGNLGIVLRHRGELDAARRAFERAAAILRARLGPDALDLAPIETNLGLVELQRGEPGAARERFERAIALQEAADSTHPNFARTLHNHATVLVGLGELDAAMRSFDRAMEINARAFDAGHPVLAERRLDLAESLHAAGATDQGVALARVALEQLSPQGDPPVRAAIEAWLGQVDQGYRRAGGPPGAGL
ncbi:MAG: serine/threonine protein kinase [Myxococcales bacterium]|nr:serine/threonine protein kinase [Myxococcales bacterium]